MYVRCLQRYTGFATKEQPLVPGKVYALDDSVAEYILATFPGTLELLAEKPEKAIRVNGRLPAREIPSEVTVALQGSPEAALITLLNAQLAVATEESKKIEAELATATAHLELLRAGLCTGEFGDEKQAEADATADEVGRLKMVQERGETTLRGLRRRLREAEVALDRVKFEKLCEQFDLLLVKNAEHYSEYQRAAREAIATASHLWADRVSATKLADEISLVHNARGFPTERKYLECAGIKVPDVNPRIARNINDRTGRGVERFDRGL